MSHQATQAEIEAVVDRVEEIGLKTELSRGEERTVIGVIGGNAYAYRDAFSHLGGIQEIVPITKPFKLASREFRKTDTVIDVGGVKAGPGPEVSLEEELERVIPAIDALHARIDVPLSIDTWRAAVARVEVHRVRRRVPRRLGVRDVLAVAQGQRARRRALAQRGGEHHGTRNMHNYALLQEAGRSGKPVLLKRGMSSTIEEWLLAAEYVLSQGNRDVILCERGIRTFETATRFTLDLNAVPLVRELSHLPVIVDPSQATGKWSLVGPMSLAAVAAGANGLIIEVHPTPNQALSDGAQSLDFEAFDRLMVDVRRLLGSMQKQLA